jgi:hypothetical protein
MVGFALSKKEARITKTLAAADAQAPAVKEALRAADAGQFQELLHAIHQSAANKDDYAVATNAVEVFRLLVDNLQAGILKIPKEVSLLDYAGFKLRVLAAAPHPEWDAMRKIVVDASAWWTAIKSKISDKALRDTFNSTIAGLEQAAKIEDRPMLNFAAQIDLDLVDLLEKHFAAKR